MVPSVTHRCSRRHATADVHSSGKEASAGAGGKAQARAGEDAWRKVRVVRRGWKGAPPSGAGKGREPEAARAGTGGGWGGAERERGGVVGRNLLWRGGRVGDVCVVSLGASLWRDGWGDAEPGWARDCGARDCAGHETAGHETAGLRDLGPWELGAESRAGRESLGTPVS